MTFLASVLLHRYDILMYWTALWLICGFKLFNRKKIQTGDIEYSECTILHVIPASGMDYLKDGLFLGAQWL